MEFIGRIYFLMLPAILGGVLNMIFVKLPILNFLKLPMDGGKKLKDGKRIFGDNKTWKGFIGMIVLTAFSALLVWGRVYPYSFLYGAWIGLGYVLAELPNSLIKRRLGIKEGANGKFIQTLFDQADSAIGCAVFLLILSPTQITLKDFTGLILISTATHYLVNVALYFTGLKKQKG